MVRVDDTRFGDDLDRLNQEDVTFLVQDGDVLADLTKQFFPKAKMLAVAANVDGPSTIQNIVTKKADAILLDRNGVLEYNKRSEQKMRLVANDRPVKYQPFVLAVARQAPDLREFLDNAIDDLKINRAIDYMLGQWEAEPGLFDRKAD
jgi:ABC-type amino acid transport substrate-binding protein